MKNKQSKLTLLSTAIALSLTLGSVAFAASGNQAGPGGPGGPGGPQDNPEVFEMGTPPDFEAGEAGEFSDSDRPEPPKDDKGKQGQPPKDDENSQSQNDSSNGRQKMDRPNESKVDPHEELMEKINALEDGDTKTDLLEKAEAAEKAMQEFMDAAKAAGLVETPPEKPENNSSAQGV